MLQSDIVRLCAPTLAGIKSAGLFSCRFDNKNETISEFRDVNVILNPKGVFAMPLMWDDNRVLVYIFRRSSLSADLSKDSIRHILDGLGYSADCENCTKNMTKCLSGLCRRFAQSAGFPHEIGLFLGYPEEDVIGFIKNHGENYKALGMWKVYGNADETLKLFDKYKKCSEIYQKIYEQGASLEKMTVAA